jgi:Flp pilus assembly protein TadG
MRRRFARDQKGAAAVEFALVIVPFLGLTFAMFEIGWAAFVSSSLENATSDTARMIRTGRDDAPASASAFKQAICERMIISTAECQARMTVNVQTFDSYSAMSGWTPPTDDSFVVGGARAIHMVRASYRQPLITPLFNLYPRDDETGDITLRSTFAFRNEPFE